MHPTPILAPFSNISGRPKDIPFTLILGNYHLGVLIGKTIVSAHIFVIVFKVDLETQL